MCSQKSQVSFLLVLAPHLDNQLICFSVLQSASLELQHIPPIKTQVVELSIEPIRSAPLPSEGLLVLPLDHFWACKEIVANEGERIDKYFTEIKNLPAFKTLQEIVQHKACLRGTYLFADVTSLHIFAKICFIQKTSGGYLPGTLPALIGKSYYFINHIITLKMQRNS